MNGISRLFAVAMVISCSAPAGAQTEVPHEFQSGTPARAIEVNENFNTLENAIDQNASDIASIPVLSGLSREAAQIRSALYLTSGLRWLVADSYSEQGRLPTDNAVAGAGAPTDWSNRFVLQSQVLDGVIQIVFAPDAAPSIADRAISLTPNDPGTGLIWFDCSGDGVTDPFLAELDCAFADEPYRPIYDRRKIVLTAFDLLSQSDAISIIQDYFNSFGSWPVDNAQAGMSDPVQYRNQYIDQLVVSNGVISVLFGGDSHASLQGASLSWEPTDNGASIEWTCDSTDIMDILLPPECR